MSKHWKSFKKHCFKMFMGKQKVNMKSVMEHLKKIVRNSKYSKSESFKKFSALAKNS